MDPAVKKRLAPAAFILMMLSLVVTLVRPRIPGSAVSSTELIGIVIQITLADPVSWRPFLASTAHITVRGSTYMLTELWRKSEEQSPRASILHDVDERAPA